MTSGEIGPLPPTWRSLRRSLQFGYRAEPVYLSLSLALTVASVLPELGMIAAFGLLAAGLEQGDGGLMALACALLGTLALAIWLFSLVAGRVNQRFADRVTVALETHVARLQAGAPGLEHHERREYLDRLAVLRNQVFALNRLYGSLFTTVALFIRVGATLGLLVSVHPVLGLIGVLALPGIAVSGWRAESVRLAQEKAAPHARRARHYFELATTPGPAKEIRVSDLSTRIIARQRAERRAWFAIVSRMRWANALWQSAGWLLFGLGFAAALWFVIVGLEAGAGAVIVVLMAGSRVAQYTADLVVEVNFLRGDWIGASRRLAWLEDFAADSHDQAARQHPPASMVTGLRFERVSFTYPGTTQEVLTDVNLFIPAGSTVAVVGENGAGKSTLVKLLAKFYEPTHGRVTFDDINLRQFETEAWRHQITGTFQDFSRLEFSLARSIGLGDLSHLDDRSRIGTAAVRAGATTLIAALPAGLDTQLGSSWRGGVDLSFGQWQKVALARGFMRRRPLLRLLDEPTSGLDAQSEENLFSDYEREIRADASDGRGTVTVLVSHRMATARIADVIVVLDGARVVEVGNHSELMTLAGRYAELYRLQTSTFR